MGRTVTRTALDTGKSGFDSHHLHKGADVNEEDARNYRASLTETEAELRRHGLTLAEFQAEVGVRSTYSGEEILNWLGY